MGMYLQSLLCERIVAASRRFSRGRKRSFANVACACLPSAPLFWHKIYNKHIVLNFTLISHKKQNTLCLYQKGGACSAKEVWDVRNVRIVRDVELWIMNYKLSVTAGWDYFAPLVMTAEAVTSWVSQVCKLVMTANALTSLRRNVGGDFFLYHIKKKTRRYGLGIWGI